MPSAIIVGSGSSAAAAALALVDHEDWRITVVDVGATLADELSAARQRLSAIPPTEWAAADLRRIVGPPATSASPGLPEKRSYGSSFAFDDHGQASNIAARDGVHARLISGAYGGFSNVWGAQFAPFSRGALDEWPLAGGSLEPHYAAVADHVGVAGVVDDLATALPLFGRHIIPPPLSARAEAIMAGYGMRREQLRATGLTLGRSRVAMRADQCVLCGLCNSGCPYGLIYSSAHTFDRLRAAGRIEYVPGMVAAAVAETESEAAVTVRDVGSGSTHRFVGDRLFLACGAVGSTRLVLASQGRFGRSVTLRESAQFVIPFASLRGTGDPRHQRDFTLGQLTALVGDPESADAVHVQVYTYDPSFLAALPAPMRARPGSRATGVALGRLSVGLGYLPSSLSPGITMRVQPPGDGGAPGLELSAQTNAVAVASVRSALRVLRRSARALDLWPVVPRVELSAPGKSYHWGGSLPHSTDAAARDRTDLLGRPGGWRRIHVVDSTVMPTIASTSFTFTMMANAHRIASSAVRLGDAG